MFSFFRPSEDDKRCRLLKKVEDGPFKDYLKVPFPAIDTPLSELEFLSLDFETTGLDPYRDVILSFGYTLLRKNKVVMANNCHQIIKINREIPKETVVIHKITDDRMATGIRLHIALEALLKAMTGKVILVHYANIEKNFLNEACKRLYGYEIPMQIVDTMVIANRHLQRTHMHFNPGQLRLFNLRESHRLPRYNAHSALEDAVATAELFLAQMARKGEMEKITLKEVMSV